jgi:uncharacterized protein YecE (DUF72 family)
MPVDETGETEALIRVGCAGLPSGLARAHYFEHVDFLEVDEAFHEPPGESAMRRWRNEAPPDAGFALLAWQLVTHDADTPGYARLRSPLAPEVRSHVGSFRHTPEVADAWARSVALAKQLRAEVILLSTPPSFVPSEPNKEALRRFRGEVANDHGDIAIAWEPRGLWEPAQAAAMARELGWIYALDPLQLETPPPDGDAAYFRLHGLGIHRNRIADDLLDVLAEMVEGYPRAWVVFANAERFADAKRFHRLLAGRVYLEDDDA